MDIMSFQNYYGLCICKSNAGFLLWWMCVCFTYLGRVSTPWWHWCWMSRFPIATRWDTAGDFDRLEANADLQLVVQCGWATPVECSLLTADNFDFFYHNLLPVLKIPCTYLDAWDCRILGRSGKYEKIPVRVYFDFTNSLSLCGPLTFE